MCKGVKYMTSTTITNLRKHLYAYVNQAVTYNDPVHIVTKDGNAVLLSNGSVFRCPTLPPPLSNLGRRIQT